MSTTAIIVVVVAIIVVAVLLGAAMMAERGRRRRRLRDRFGLEYDRTVDATGSPKDAEEELRGRLDRRDRLVIQPLSVARRDRFQQDWRQVQRDLCGRAELGSTSSGCPGHKRNG